MLNSRLFVIASVAALSVIFLSYTQAADFSAFQSLQQQFLPPEFRNQNYTLEDVKTIYKEKCKKASGMDNSTLYRDVERAATKLVFCMQTIANITGLQEEIAAARPNGELDTVFHKYCTKAPTIEGCMKEFNAAIQPCLTVAEKAQNVIMERLMTRMLSFACARGGDQIALFVAEDGPECFEANKEAITKCANRTFTEFIPKDGRMPDLFNLPELIVKPEHCNDLDEFQACVIHHLEQCRDITPANVADSVFKVIKQETSCKSWLENKSSERSILKDPRSSAATGSFVGMLWFTIASVAVLLKFLI